MIYTCKVLQMETSHSNFIDCSSHKFNKLHKCVFRSISYYSAVFPRILHYSPLYTLFSTILTVLYYSLLFFSIPYYSPLYTLFSTIVTIHYYHCSPAFPTILHYYPLYTFSQQNLSIPNYSLLLALFSLLLSLFSTIPYYSAAFSIIYTIFNYYHYSLRFPTISKYSKVFLDNSRLL